MYDDRYVFRAPLQSRQHLYMNISLEQLYDDGWFVGVHQQLQKTDGNITTKHVFGQSLERSCAPKCTGNQMKNRLGENRWACGRAKYPSVCVCTTRKRNIHEHQRQHRLPLQVGERHCVPRVVV